MLERIPNVREGGTRGHPPGSQEKKNFKFEVHLKWDFQRSEAKLTCYKVALFINLGRPFPQAREKITSTKLTFTYL